MKVYFLVLLAFVLLSTNILSCVGSLAAQNRLRMLQLGVVRTIDSFNFSSFNLDQKIKWRSNSFKSSISKYVSFKAYKPLVFRNIRLFGRISEKEFLETFQDNPDHWISFVTDSKSNQEFWTSNNEYFVVKSISRREYKMLMKLVDDIESHCIEDDTLLALPLGMYRIKKLFSKKYYLVMKNIYYDKDLKPYLQSKKYDLKGSTIGRTAKPWSTVQKDLDLLNRKNFFHVGGHKYEIYRILQRDVKMLAQNNVMDYSFLVAEYEKKLESAHDFSQLERWWQEWNENMQMRWNSSSM